MLPPDADAGLHAETGDRIGGLLHVGETWAGASYQVPWHQHDAWEFYLQLHGGSSWDLGARTLYLAPGWLVAVPPGMRHRGMPRAVGDTARHHFAYVAVDLDVAARRAPDLAAEWLGRSLLCTPHGMEVAVALRRLMAEVAENRPHRPSAIAAAVDLLLVDVTRALLPLPGATTRSSRHPVVARARQLLDDQYATGWTLELLAVACGTSRTRLAELFTAEVGQPPYAYLLARRVDRAAELLASTPYSVAEVAAAVGFGSHVQLARHFRRARGASPTEWRRQTRS